MSKLGDWLHWVILPNTIGENYLVSSLLASGIGEKKLGCNLETLENKTTKKSIKFLFGNGN